jgi:hypothetical protein
VERLSDYSDDDYQRITAERLLTDADLALTFAEIAAARREPESIARTVRNAWKVFEQISKRRLSLPTEEEDSIKLEGKLIILKKRLTELGERLD